MRLRCAAEFDDLIGPGLRQVPGQVHAHVAERVQVLALRSVLLAAYLLVEIGLQVARFA